MGNGVKPKPRMAKGGCQATTSHLSTVWRSIPGTTGRCPATPPSTCWAAGSTAASWSGRVRAVLARGPSRWDTKGECTTTGSTLLLTARWGPVREPGGCGGPRSCRRVQPRCPQTLHKADSTTPAAGWEVSACEDGHMMPRALAYCGSLVVLLEFYQQSDELGGVSVGL